MNSVELAWKIRRHAIEMTHLSHGSHIASVLSIADIIAYLYSDVLLYDVKKTNLENRDRFILSKGHAGAAIYAALSEVGFFDVDELKTHYQDGSRLSGHVSHHVPGVEFSTGSLGHGLSAGAGMAFAAKKNKENWRTFVLLGDGECDEGSVWEAAMFANHFRLNNLIAIVDRNQMQSLDFSENTIELENFAAKWNAFGWNVVEANGNSHEELKKAFNFIQKLNITTDKPTVLIANTIKGYGISFMQNDILWHYRFPHEGWEYDCAVNELHENKPHGVIDVYTPLGVTNPKSPIQGDDIYNDHTFTKTWYPEYPNKPIRVTAKPGSVERMKKVDYER